MTHVHVCCTRAHASHICINQKAGGENLVHPIMVVCERAGGSAAGSFYVHLHHQKCCYSWSPDGGVC